jgi:amino acid adenylation domain-containing protein
MSVYQLTEKAALQYGDSTAVVYEKKTVTYQQLFAKVYNLSNAILHHAKEQQFIGISATRSIEMIAGVLAILKAGKTYVPLDANYPPLRLQQLIEDSKIEFTLCLDDESDFFKELQLSPIISNKEYHYPSTEIPFYSSTVCVLYTSGSTGKPKGVCLGHQGFINQINWQKQNGIAKPGIKTLQFCHLSFDAAFQEIFVPLSTGGTLYIVNDTYRLNTGNLLHYIVANAINRLFLPYAVVQFLAETSALYQLYPTSVQEIITGGELLKITPQISQFFNIMSHCILMNVYGPTEASIWVTELKLKGNALEWPAIPSIGNPAVGAQLFIADEELNLLPDGEVGEILIHGDCLALEYLNKPEQTAERFINWNHPQLGEIRVYRTGDLAAYNNDGTLQFHGRRDGQVKIRGGNRVELGEIEVVIGNITGISQVKVIVREDKPNQKNIVAYVLLTNNTLTEDTIKKEVAAHLPDYMIPSAVVILQEFPLTVSGKIDVRAFPAPEIQLEINSDFKAASTKTETYLKELWEDLLQLKNISINDNFFEIGGNSLFAIQMMIRIEKNTGKQLPLISVFDHSTIESLAELIDADITFQFSPLVAIKASGKRTPVYLIHGDGLNVINFNGIAKHIHPDQPVYGLQPKGIDGKSEPLETIEAIAQYYNQAIIQHNPNGPYAIVGYSFGGYVAIEMVKQLKQMKRPVLLLGMFDTNVLNAENILGWHKKLGRKLMRQFPKFMWIIKSFVDNPAAVLEYQLTSFSRRVRQTFSLGTKPVNPEIEVYYHLMDKINEKHYNALLKYNLEKYDGKVVMFKAMERPYFVDDFKYLGWQKYALQGVDVYDIPGDHLTMFAEPNCQILAKQIDTALLNAQK